MALQIIFLVCSQPHLGILGAALGIHHQRIFRQESSGYCHRAVEQAARIVAQIQHQALERFLVLLVEAVQRLGQILAGMLLELGDADIAIARFDQFGFYALDFDHGAREGDDQRFGFALADHGQGDLGAGLAAHAFDRIIQRQSLDRGFIQLDDQVAAFYAGQECGRILDRGHHLDEAVFHADFDAQAAEFTLGADLQILERSASR